MNVYEKARFSVTISEEIVNWLDEECSDMGCSRSWLIENMLYSIMIHQRGKKDENIKNDKQHIV